MTAEPALEAVSLRRAATRERLMTAAVTVFAERGVNGASVEEISEAAGFTRGAFYSNFADKNALVLAMIEHNIAIQYAAVEQAIESMKAARDSSPEQLVSVALTALAQSGRTPDQSTLAAQELLLHAAREPELRGPYLDFLEQCQRQLRVLIADALRHVGREFTIPFDHAIDVLAAVHGQSQLTAVFRQQPPDQSVISSLLMAITRPI